MATEDFWAYSGDKAPTSDQAHLDSFDTVSGLGSPGPAFFSSFGSKPK